MFEKEGHRKMWRRRHYQHFRPRSLLSSFRKTSKSLPQLLTALLGFMFFLPVACSQRNSAFFNASSLISIPGSEWNLSRGSKEVAFRTCSDLGSLISMNGSLASSTSASLSSSSNSQRLALLLSNKSVIFQWSINGQSNSVNLGSNISNNTWYTLTLGYLLGALKLSISIESAKAYEITVANSSLNPELLNVKLNGTMKIGDGFTGCMYQGPGVNFSSSGAAFQGITWDTCPLSQLTGCAANEDTNDCWSNPCRNGASCIDGYRNYTCKCPPNFNGSQCENDLARLYGCQVSPCLNGGTCNVLQGPSAFNCSCPPGYNGLTCENRMDMCRLTPCARGVCISTNNSYICNCSQTGYKGQNCTDNIDECILNSTICGPNGTCYDLPGYYTCACPEGFSGTPCQNVDECISQPCSSGATCIDGINSYTCTCAAGYTGVYPNCTDINECNLQYCQHSANCTNSPGGYSCTCLTGYTGPNCSTIINLCDSNPCLNATNCTGTANSYTCSCLPGFSGKNCDSDIIDCLPGRCLNNAGCLELVNNYSCLCQPGFTGSDCGRDINECDSNPCQNGAQCNNLNNSFTCNCTAGYEGPTCALEINMCKLYNNPCKNNGTCLYVANDYFCNCTGEWMGKNCTEPYDSCASQPCQNNGTCSSQKLSHAYSCSCASGFTGDDCRKNIDDCWNVTCPNNSICYDGINSHKCDCPIGFTGAKCETEIDECQVQPCENGGTCTSGRGNKTCACVQSTINVNLPNGSVKSYTSGYTGRNCEIDIDECNITGPICQNGGMCQNTPKGSFSCYCKTNVSGGEMYVGALCEQLRSYCDIRLSNQTCQHGGKCVNLQMSSKCECAPGFTGSYCEHDIDDCILNPCGLNGNCTDLVNNYTCSCIDGITGRNCETNINDCDPDPCLNKGVCIDGINNPRYTCNCSKTGFNGSRCEYNIDDCSSSPCQNGGNCTDAINNYTCQCYKGYTGSNCHIDIQECTPNPCGYNSTCLEYSNKTLYDKGDPNFVNFTYDRAAGYLCVCVPGVTGSNCSIDVDECLSNPCLHNSKCKDQFNGFSCICSPGYQGPTCDENIDECKVYKPCQHNGICSDKIADYLCTCQPPEPLVPSYGGKNCSTLLTGCDGNGCKNGACIPKLDFTSVPEKHGYDCQCNSGYTGTYCDITTSMSFVSPTNYVRFNTTASPFELSLQFRTSFSSVVLLVLKLQGGNAYVAVQIDAGKVQLKFKDITSKVVTLDTLLLMNDSAYHSLVLSVSGSLAAISLPDDRCAVDLGAVGGGSQSCNKSVSLEAQRNVSSLSIGSAAPLGITNEVFPADFIGCVEDLRSNKQLYYPGLANGEFINVIAGCSRVDQCTPASCSKHGSCEDLWNKYICHCNRPYKGRDCEAENPAGTFGVFPGSYVDYIFPPSSAIDNATISFFIVTRQRDGFIMLASNGYSTTGSNNILSFLALYINNFQLSGDFHKCNFTMSFTSNRSVSDGQRHLLSIAVKDSNLTIFCDSEKVFERTKIPSTCRSGFGFLVEKLTFGKYRGVQRRSKREALMPIISSEENEVLVTRVKRQAYLTNLSAVPDLEGVIQDIQLNSVILDFEDVPQEKNLTLGAVSTRSACNDSLEGLCFNGGTCRDIFYNDYNCTCLRGYRGKNCSELDFCSYGSCPTESTCVNLPGGYECVANASFLNDDSSIQYTMNGSTPKPSLTFQFRTRGLYGLIFLLRYGDYFFKVRVAGGALEINSKLSPEFSETAKTNAQRPVNDGKWYSASFDIFNETHVELVVYSEGKAIDGTGRRLINSSSVNISDMLSYGELVLGNTLRTKYSREWEANYRGCLREVRMGGVLMPFYTDDTFVNNSFPVKFLAKAVTGIAHNCIGDDVCKKHFCLNNGQCMDMWNHFTCKCPPGFYGDYCENNPDNCGANVCQNGGLCVDGLDSSTCTCPAGYTNNVCEDAVNLCGNNSCWNSTCVSHGQDYICNCTGTEFTGWYCNVSIHQNCNQVTCQNQGTCSNVTLTANSTVSFNCACPPGYEGPLCEKAIDYCSKDGVKCANNGTCENHVEYQNYTCHCDNTTGFTGPNCTDKKKDTCLTGICVNGACVSGVDNYTCNCFPGYDGPKCDTPVDPCKNGSFCQRGMCKLDGSCNCTGSGWTGTGCDKDVDECQSNVCQHGANCTNLEGDYNCNCTLGYSGKNCDIPNCSGIQCNKGDCISNTTDWWCKCVEYVGGKFCDLIGPCYYNPCVHSSGCIQSIEFDNYTCACKSGWKGVNCSEDINECNETNPSWQHKCQNGTCVNSDGNYSCSCRPGYDGYLCGHEIDECDPSPCLHNSSCANMINNYTCNCTDTGFIGQNCSQDIDECSLNSTLCNQGKCLNKEPFYTCDCGESYLGDHCQYANPCVNTTCLNGGTCQVKNETDLSYHSWCSCSGNYEGATCEKSPSTKDTDLGIIIGPIIGGIVFIIIVIVVIAFIMTARSKRATRGAYSPSQQETSGSRVELGNVLKKPPEERLI